MSFDSLAPHYRWMELVLAGGKLHHCRTAFLDEIPTARNILLLGEGHGRGLVECCRRFHNARITYVDASKAMLVQARRQWMRGSGGATKVEFLHADLLLGIPSNHTYGLIITNFFLDCFRAEQLEQMIPRIAQVASPDGHWLIADFQEADQGLPRLRSRFMLWMMYGFFRRATGLSAQKLIAPAPYLQRAGFTLRKRVTSEWGLLRSDWWQSLHPNRGALTE